MTVIRSLVVLCALAAVSAPGSLRAVMLEDAQVIPPARPATDVFVRDVRTANDTVSGTVVNRAPDPVRNVRLVVSHVWVWDNELHPGDDDFSHADYYVVPGEIPGGGQLAFTVPPPTSLHEGRGGSFMTEVKVTSFDVMQQGGRAPTPGTTSAEPPAQPLQERGTHAEPPARAGGY